MTMSMRIAQSDVVVLPIGADGRKWHVRFVEPPKGAAFIALRIELEGDRITRIKNAINYVWSLEEVQAVEGQKPRIVDAIKAYTGQ